MGNWFGGLLRRRHCRAYVVCVKPLARSAHLIKRRLYSTYSRQANGFHLMPVPCRSLPRFRYQLAVVCLTAKLSTRFSVFSFVRGRYRKEITKALFTARQWVTENGKHTNLVKLRWNTLVKAWRPIVRRRNHRFIIDDLIYRDVGAGEQM